MQPRLRLRLAWRRMARPEVMDDLTFSAASSSDLAHVRALLADCLLPTDDLHEEQLKDFVLCRAGGELVGTVGLEAHGEVALLRSLAVVPGWRGRGLAHRLSTVALAEARRRGLRRLYLLTTTAADLFARWGFRPVGRDTGSERDSRDSAVRVPLSSTAVVMTLDLTG